MKYFASPVDPRFPDIPHGPYMIDQKVCNWVEGHDGEKYETATIFLIRGRTYIIWKFREHNVWTLGDNVHLTPAYPDIPLHEDVGVAVTMALLLADACAI